MKRSIILFATLTGMALASNAEVTLSFNVEQTSKEYGTNHLESCQTQYGPYQPNPSSPNFSSTEITTDGCNKIVFKMRLRGDFMEQLAYIRKYSSSEFFSTQDKIIVKYRNYNDNDVNVRFTTTWQEVGSSESYTIVRNAGFGSTKEYYDRSAYTYYNIEASLTEHFPERMRLNPKKFYDITITAEHETVNLFNLSFFTVSHHNGTPVYWCDFIKNDGENNTMTVQKDNGEIEKYESILLVGGIKACNNLYSGVVSMTDKAGNATTVDNGGSGVRNDIQPNYRPVVRLYDLNSKQWLKTARCHEGTSGLLRPEDRSSWEDAESAGECFQTYYVTTDSLVAKHDFTNNKSLEDGGYYTEMEINNDTLCFNSGPLDYTHTYALVVATSSAGWAGTIWDFEKGELKKLNSLTELYNYPVTQKALMSDARKNRVQVNVNIVVDPSFYTAIDDIDASSNEPAVYYNLSGHSSTTPFAGLNILKRGNKVTKEMYNL